MCELFSRLYLYGDYERSNDAAWCKLRRNGSMVLYAIFG